MNWKRNFLQGFIVGISCISIIAVYSLSKADFYIYNKESFAIIILICLLFFGLLGLLFGKIFQKSTFEQGDHIWLGIAISFFAYILFGVASLGFLGAKFNILYGLIIFLLIGALTGWIVGMIGPKNNLIFQDKTGTT